MNKMSIGLGLALIGAGLSAEKLSLWQQVGHYFERKHAVKEWQNLIAQPDVNYQQALLVFGQFDQKFTATDAEKEKFRNWKKSVRWHATPDGLIYDAKKYMGELSAFRSPALPTPNDAEKPLFYPAPAAGGGSKISFGLPNDGNLGYWVSAGYRGNPDVAGGATGNGGATGVAFDPKSPNIVYACVRNGGLWKSFDYGKTYTAMTDYFESPYCEGVGVGTDNSQVVYLLQSGKLWYSDDGGQSWENRNTGFTGSADEVHVDPQNSNRAIITGEQGLFLTIDAGQSWTKVLSGTFRELETTSDWSTLGTAKDVGNPNASFFMSTDQGTTWKEVTVTSDRTGLYRLYLGFHQRANPDSLVVYTYLLKSGNTPTRYYGLFRSDDRGRNFTEVKAPGYAYPNGIVPLNGDSVKGYKELDDGYGGVNPYTTSSWVSEFWVSPANPDHMITMREKLWYSTNGGKTWNYGPSYGEAGWADRRFATANPTKDTLWICDDGGLGAVALADLFPWAGNGSKYIYKNGTIAAPEGTNLGISTYNKDVFMTGGQDVGQVFQRNGKSSHVHKVDVYRGQINPYNDSIYWTGGFIHRLTDSSTVSLSNQVEPDRFDPLRVYGFDGNAILYRTKKGQNAWDFSDRKTEANASTTGMNHSTAFAEIVDLSTTGVSAWNSWTFEQSRASADLAFIGDEKGRRLFKTENLSADVPTWTQVSSAPSMGRYRIATHPHNAKLIALAGDKAVWISRDGGESWNELSGFPATGVIGILFDPNTSEGLYVCNALTVWYRDETLKSWSEFNRGLPLQQIVEMKMAHYADGESRLWIAKYGRGVWSSPLISSLRQKQIRADFAVHSLSKKSMYAVGDSVRLYDLSSGEIQTRNWTVTGPSATQTQSGSSEPKFVLSQPGLYNVSLRIVGPKGTDSIYKNGFLQVQPNLHTLDSSLANQSGGVWYLGIGSVNVNGLNHGSSGNTNLFYEDLTKATPFKVNTADSASALIIPSYNDGTWGVSYARIYVDWNNSGSFDSTELVYNSGAARLQGHAFKFLAPANAVKDLPLRMRVLANRMKQITGPYASQFDQGQVEDHTIVVESPAAQVGVQVTYVGSDSLFLSGSSSLTTNVVDQGFLYSAFRANPDMNGPGRISAKSLGSSFGAGLGQLPKNRKYYVRSYAIDSRGTWLSPVDSVVLNSYKIPVVQALNPVFDSVTTLWTAYGRISTEGRAVDSVIVEYGLNGIWDQKVRMNNPKGLGTWDTLGVALPRISDLGLVQYRIRLYSGHESFVSTAQYFSSEKNLYAYWSFDDSTSTAWDYSGHARHIVLGAGLDRVADDRGGQALRFDSTADQATIGLNNLAQPFTLMLRVKRSQNSPIGSAGILNGSNRRFDLEGWNNSRKVAFQAQNLYDRTTTYSAPVNEWHAIAAVVQNDSAKLYVDGALHSSYAVASYTLPLATFGKAGSSMIGLLDEVKVYQSALNLSEIKKSMLLLPKITFAPLKSVTEGDPALALVATSNLSRTVRFEVVNGASLVQLSGNMLTPLAAGTVLVRAYTDADSIYAADTVLQILDIQPKQVVARKSPIEFPELSVQAGPRSVWFGLNMDLLGASLRVVGAEGQVRYQGDFKRGTVYPWELRWNLTQSTLGGLSKSNAYIVVDLQHRDGRTERIQKNWVVGE